MQGNLAPRGRGGGQRAVRPITPRSFSVGARADGRERGAGGGEESSGYSVDFSVSSEIEGMKAPSEEGRSIGATSEGAPSEEQRSEGASSDGAPA